MLEAPKGFDKGLPVVGQSAQINSYVVYNTETDRSETIITVNYGDGQKSLSLAYPVNDAELAKALRRLADGVDPRLELMPWFGEDKPWTRP